MSDGCLKTIALVAVLCFLYWQYSDGGNVGKNNASSYNGGTSNSGYSNEDYYNSTSSSSSYYNSAFSDNSNDSDNSATSSGSSNETTRWQNTVEEEDSHSTANEIFEEDNEIALDEEVLDFCYTYLSEEFCKRKEAIALMAAKAEKQKKLESQLDALKNPKARAIIEKKLDYEEKIFEKFREQLQLVNAEIERFYATYYTKESEDSFKSRKYIVDKLDNIILQIKDINEISQEID